MKIANTEIIMFPAKSGDCIIVHFLKEKFRILIDGGYVSTYNDYLKPYLLELGKSGEKLDLIIVTHIDRDHINGIKKLLEENGNANSPNIIEIGEIWFNSFRNIVNLPKDGNNIIPFSEKGILSNMASNNCEQVSEGSENVSFSDGNCLAEIIVKNEYNWNTSFKKLVSCDDTPKVTYGDIKISILNPGKDALNDLATIWLKEISNRCKKVVICDNHLFDKAFEGCFIYDMEYPIENKTIAYSEDTNTTWENVAKLDDDAPDKSASNLSSIAILIEEGEKTYLFTGDCPLSIIQNKVPSYVTVVKLSHHGSGKSNIKEFIKAHEVDYYLISTDGSHGHPSKTIVGNILCCTNNQPIIVKNYDLPVLSGVGIMGEDLVIDE